MAAIEEVAWASDELEAVVLPAVGARLHRLRAFGVDLLRTPADPATHHDDPFFWGAYVMAPWTNRARAGDRQLASRQVRLAPNFPDGTAIHGLVHAARWQRTGDATFAVQHDGAGWPWQFSVELAVGLAGPRLTLDYRLVNDAGGPMPAGIGLHPWFRRPVAVGLAARAVHAPNDDPAAVAQPAAGALALPGDAPLPIGLDGTWLDVAPPEVGLRWPDLRLAARLRATTDGALHVAVASPQQPGAVAIEPVTHAPWALDRPGGLRLLDPGAALRFAVELEVARD